MVVLLVLIGIIILFFFIINWIQNKTRTAKIFNQFPGPNLPPFGIALMFSARRDKLFSDVRRYIDSYNETFRHWALHIPTIQIVTPEDAEIILSNPKYIHKGLMYKFLEPWIKEGLLVSNGEKWFQRRKILTYAFHFNILRKFVSIFGDHCEEFSKKLEEECSNDQTDIMPLVNQMTLANICETAMGTKLDPKNEVQNEYLTALYRVGIYLVKRFFAPWLYNDWIFSMTSISKNMSKCISILHKFTRNVINERKLNFNDEDVTNLEENEEVISKKKRLAMLDLLIYNQKKDKNIDDEGIQEEVDTFMFEGHDTTSVATQYMLMTLANHPDIQEKIISEMDSIFGDSNRTPTYDDLQNMKYSEMVIKESLRLYPSVFVIARLAEEDIKLNEHTIPAGTEVFIHIYNIHRDPRYFPDPEKFDPDRFLPENCKGRHPYAYIPFSAGPRNCIGQKFAMLELKSILAAVFRQFRLKPIDNAADLTWIIDFVLRSTGPIRVKVEKRNKITG